MTFIFRGHKKTEIFSLYSDLTIDAQIDQAVFCNLKAAGCDIHRRKAKAPSIGI